jgi:hypothetical protein
MAYFEVRQRPRQRHWSANITIHLSRRRKLFFFAEHSLRPGDGERYAVDYYVVSLYYSCASASSLRRKVTHLRLELRP